MTWTFSGDPDGEPKDEVRMLVGDTNATATLLSDEEIEHLLALMPPAAGKPAWLAAALACDSICGKLARKMQQSIGPISASSQQQWEHYRDMAQQFRVLYATNGLGVIQGSMAGIKAAAPVLSGGGKTYLGGSNYSNSGDGGGA